MMGDVATIGFDMGAAAMPCGVINIRIGSIAGADILVADAFMLAFVLADMVGVSGAIGALVLPMGLAVASSPSTVVINNSLTVGSTISAVVFTDFIGMGGTVIGATGFTMACEAIFLALVLVEGVDGLGEAAFGAALFSG